MSHYTILKTFMKDSTALVKALADMGYSTVEVLDVPLPLYGYQGDFRKASDLNAHTRSADEAKKAHVIVRRKYIDCAANDLGFERLSDGTFGAIISGYDSRRHNAAWVNKLQQRYSYHVAKKKVVGMGFTVQEKVLEDGTIKLLARR